MADSSNMDPMLEMFLFENNLLIEQLEEIILQSEKTKRFETEDTNEIFRIMHTIKGSAAMMMFNPVSKVAHSLEDLFDFIRKNQAVTLDFKKLSDLVLAAIDFMKQEFDKIAQGGNDDGSPDELLNEIKNQLQQMQSGLNLQETQTVQTESKEPKQEPVYYIAANSDKTVKNQDNKKYSAFLTFEADCQMENVRAYMVVHNVKNIATELFHNPPDIISNNDSAEWIREKGFYLYFSTACDQATVEKTLQETAFVQSMELKQIEDYPEEVKVLYPEVFGICNLETVKEKEVAHKEPEHSSASARQQNIISVNVAKLDLLMDLVGEIVISEAMVTRNPDLEGLELHSFNKAARQLRKLTKELQDVVMSVRMVPIAGTFHKMNRIVRDMGRKLNKDVDLELIGENTEVDKNIIDHISDPLMHLIRNSMDHGIEERQERVKLGKSPQGKVTLEARNEGGDVWLFVRDDGRGLNRNKILAKAREQGLVSKPEHELSDREIFSFILLPGFSTKEQVTEFSGRGVGMDVVTRNIEQVGGSVSVESTAGQGSEIQIKIPLTLAIIDGMEVGVGQAKYMIPTTSIRESFRAEEQDIIADASGNELIMIRGECYPVFRLNHLFKLNHGVEKINDGIMVMLGNDDKAACLFVDQLIGEQQVVVKALPSYLKKVKGIAGCTILGDGSISLILDVNGILEKKH